LLKRFSFSIIKQIPALRKPMLKMLKAERRKLQPHQQPSESFGFHLTWRNDFNVIPVIQELLQLGACQNHFDAVHPCDDVVALA
jgi:hypothetical protein